MMTARKKFLFFGGISRDGKRKDEEEVEGGSRRSGVAAAARFSVAQRRFTGTVFLFISTNESWWGSRWWMGQRRRAAWNSSRWGQRCGERETRFPPSVATFGPHSVPRLAWRQHRAGREPG